MIDIDYDSYLLNLTIIKAKKGMESGRKKPLEAISNDEVSKLYYLNDLMKRHGAQVR